MTVSGLLVIRNMRDFALVIVAIAGSGAYNVDVMKRAHRMKSILATVAFLSAATFVLALSPAWATEVTAASIRVEPPRLTISSPRDVAQFVVSATMSDGSTRDVTAEASVRCSPRVAALAGYGRLAPTGSGRTVVTLSWRSLTAKVPITVAASAMAKQPVSFLREIEPILTRAGCNQGACHGSQFGKGSFKLSLFAYDPEADYDSMLRGSGGRRIAFGRPSSSLLLRKASMAAPHQGGLRLAADSADYKALEHWIAEGASGPEAKLAQPISLTVYPRKRIMAVGDTQPMTAVAAYADGTVRDVTRHARFTPIDEHMTKVTASAVAQPLKPGSATVMVRYDGLAAACNIIVPYSRRVSEPALAAAPTPKSFIDPFVRSRWDELGLTPSARSTDTQFLRRASLDLIGTLPTVEEVRSFAADRRTDKRTRLVDHLLERSEYTDYWTLKWSDLLRNSRATVGKRAMWSLNSWLRMQFAANRPFDKMARDLITAGGGVAATGAAAYYRVASTPTDLTETTAQLFLGVRMQCAKCHHHPFEKWSQGDYYRFAAFFAQVAVRPGADAGEHWVSSRRAGEVVHPKSGLNMAPAPLDFDGSASRFVSEVGTEDRRLELAAWLTAPANKQFARTVVNRYWSYLLGRGLVDPVDDMRVTNPPSNPELLDALAERFIRSGYDLKWLLRSICASEAYHLGSVARKGSEADTVFYSHFLPKRLPAEVLLDAVSAAAESPEKFAELPLGVRAISLPDASVNSAFLDQFGRPARATACECERVAEPSLGQALVLITGDSVNRMVCSPKGRVARLVESQVSISAVVRELYCAALSREPTPREITMALRAISESADRRRGVEDLAWALINSTEFRYVL